MKLAIVTVDFNGHADTKEFLQSAKKLKFPKGLEVQFITVDNGSSEPLPGATIQAGGNLGFAGGYNRGIAYGLAWGADFVAVVNNDVIFPDPQLFTKLITVLESDDRIGIVSPKILFAPGYEFHKDRYSKTEIGKVVWYAGGHLDWNNVASVHRGVDEVDHGQYAQTEQTGFVSGCCFVAKRRLLEQTGMFTEKLFAYYEDADLNQRISRSSWQRYYCGQASLYHKVSQTAGIGSQLTDYLLTRNRLYFGFKYARAKTKFALAREALRFLLTGREYQKRGVWDFVQGKFGRPNFVSSNSVLHFPLKLSVVVINYKTVALTRECLLSLSEADEVILIDNASGDDCAKMVKEFPKVKFIANKVNRGFSGANNQGIDYSRGEYVLLLNSDAAAKKNGLKNLVEATDKLGGDAITAGRLFFPDGSDQDSVFNLPTVWGAVKEYFLQSKGSYFMFRPQVMQQVECAVMACLLIPRRVISKIGKLDEGTFMYFEDVEYCRRAKENHIPIYFVPEAEFVHHHGASSKKIGKDQAYSLLKKGSYHYHGFVNYWLLYIVLWFGQRLGSKSPESRWSKS